MVVTLEIAFGERVRQVRTFRGLSQDELGALVGVDKSTISKYEKGRRGLSISAVIEISAALNTSPAWLLFGGTDTTEIKVGARVHQASQWWEWLSGVRPLPDEDAKDFFRSALVDQLPITGDQVKQMDIEGTLPTPHRRLFDEVLKVGYEDWDRVNIEIRQAGYYSYAHFLDTHPEAGVWTPDEIREELKRERLG